MTDAVKVTPPGGVHRLHPEQDYSVMCGVPNDSRSSSSPRPLSYDSCSESHPERGDAQAPSRARLQCDVWCGVVLLWCGVS